MPFSLPFFGWLYSAKVIVQIASWKLLSITFAIINGSASLLAKLLRISASHYWK
jgi:hypothetical protein